MKKKTDRALRIIAKVLLTCIHWGLIINLAVMFVLMILQIFLRSFVGTSIKWSDELLRYQFIWLVFLGFPSAIYYGELTRFDMLEQKFGPTARKILCTVLDTVAVIVLCLLYKGATTLVRRQMTHMATTMNLSMGIVYSVILVSAGAGIVFLLIDMYFRWTNAASLKDGGDRV